MKKSNSSLTHFTYSELNTKQRKNILGGTTTLVETPSKGTGVGGTIGIVPPPPPPPVYL